MRRKKLIALIMCMILCMTAFYGCAEKDSGQGAEGQQNTEANQNTEAKQTDYDIKIVKCIYNYGDQDKAEMDVFSSDKSVRSYIVNSYSDSGIDLFSGEIPSDNNTNCDIEEITLTDEEWNNIVNAVKDSNFMDLPDELPKVKANDGSTCYIEIETTTGTHRSGGYCAGNGSGKEHERFYSVKSVLYGLIR